MVQSNVNASRTTEIGIVRARFITGAARVPRVRLAASEKRGCLGDRQSRNRAGKSASKGDLEHIMPSHTHYLSHAQKPGKEARHRCGAQKGPSSAWHRRRTLGFSEARGEIRFEVLLGMKLPSALDQHVFGLGDVGVGNAAIDGADC